MAEQESFLDRLKGTITYQALESLGRSAMLPGQVWGGEVAVDSPEGIGRALEFAGNAPLGAVASVAGMAARGITPDPGTLSTFIGPRTLEGLGMATRPSKHDADLLRASIEAAHNLPAVTQPPSHSLGTASPLYLRQADHPAVQQLDDIWRAQDAPWFVGPDQYLKREVSDLGIDLTTPSGYVPYAPYPQQLNIRHPNPELINTLGVQAWDNPQLSSMGAYNRNLNMMAFPGRRNMPTTIAHELQHSIQNMENWPRGGNPANLLNHPATIATHFANQRPGLTGGLQGQSAPPGWGSATQQMTKEDAARQTYRRLMGEAEARAVEHRLTGNYQGHPLTYWDIPFNRLLHK